MGLDLYWCNEKGNHMRMFQYTDKENTYKITNIIGYDEYGSENFITLNAKKKYYLGMDMSLTQSGIGILNEELKPIAMIDIIANNMDKSSLLQHLKNFLKVNFEHVTFGMVAIETTFDKGYKLTNKALSELRGSIMDSVGIFGVKIEGILPNVWRKWFLKGKQYEGQKKNSLDVKIAVSQEVINRTWSYTPVFFNYIDFMMQYSKSVQGNVCDSCDGIGIISGAIEEAYGEFAIKPFRQVNKLMRLENTHALESYCYKFDISTSTVIDDKDQNDIKTKPLSDVFLNERRLRGEKIYIYNSKLSLDENIRRCTSEHNEVCIILCQSGIQVANMSWRFGQHFNDNELPIIICYAKHSSRKTNNIDYLYDL